MTTLSINQSLQQALYKRMTSIGLINDKSFIADCILTANGFQDLHIESLGAWRDKSGRSQAVISMAHYYIQNGEMMRNPDVVFGINHKTRAIYPLSYRNDSLGANQDVLKEGSVNTIMEKDIGRFLKIWLTNIEQQGFVDGLSKTSPVGTTNTKPF